MHVLALAIDLHLPVCRSLKEKRATVRPIIDGIRNRFAVAVAETDHQDLRQRAEIGVATVSSSAKVATQVVAEVERFVWSFPEVEVLSMHRYWAERDSGYFPDDHDHDYDYGYDDADDTGDADDAIYGGDGPALLLHHAAGHGPEPRHRQRGLRPRKRWRLLRHQRALQIGRAHV